MAVNASSKGRSLARVSAIARTGQESWCRGPDSAQEIFAPEQLFSCMTAGSLYSANANPLNRGVESEFR